MLEKDFLQLCDKALSKLASELENQDKDSVLEVDYVDGILTIQIEATSQTYIINRNTASQKIWYSSPISGADYFAFDQARNIWIDAAGRELSEKIFAELSALKIAFVK